MKFKKSLRNFANKFNRPIRQNGVSMIEVLIAIVIFAFGVLALASLQLASLKYQKGAWFRAGAASLTTDIGERMRANSIGVEAGNYVLTGNYTDLVNNPPEPSGCDYASQVCTAAEVAQNDLANWAQLLASEMPGGVGTLSGTNAAGFLATIMWSDKNAVDKTAGQAGTTFIANKVCDQTTAVTQNCCPAGTPDGIKCTRAVILP